MSISWEATAKAKARLVRERGTIHKDWGGRLPVALVYPNTYSVGMSGLGLQILYRLFNDDPEVVCERAFYEPAGRSPSAGEPVLSLESQRPLGDFAALAFSVTYELDYYHVVSTLRDSGLPLWAAERDDRHPLVIAGGPCLTANPEPLAPFCDAIVIGEAEPIVVQLLAALAGGDREQTLRTLAGVPGVYVPSLYQPIYAPDGSIVDLERAGEAPPVVGRVWLRDLDADPGASAVLTPDAELADMFLVEVARGCARGCLYCLAGYCFLPARERSPESVLRSAREGLKQTPKIGLVGAAVADYSHFEEVVRELQAEGARVSVASLRVDSLSEPIARALAGGGARTVTLGVEAGSQHLRDLVHKGVSTKDLEKAIDAAGAAGFAQAKLYFMIGLPGESDADVEAIGALSVSLGERFAARRRGGRVVVSVTPFVPKAQTPYQWTAMAEPGLLRERLARLQTALRPRKIELRAESVDWALVEGVLARGDRRLAEVLARMDRNSLAAWGRALAEQGLSAEFYLRRHRPVGEVLPWAAVSTGVRAAALAKLGGEDAGPGGDAFGQGEPS
ncbi:MAG: B12-binding domain-containing radical SAM protein [Chloroflexi bacterium]|nr:B12-binding domain-containing radical SAM protein [Chloroflexota bacterium]